MLYKSAETKQKDDKKLLSRSVLLATGLKVGADIPKFVLLSEAEKGIGKGIGALPKTLPPAFSRESLRATGRFTRKALSGSMVGAFTFPLMAHGVRNVASDDPKQKALGLAEVAGASGAYSAIKGATEHAARHEQLSAPSAKSLLSRLRGKQVPPSLRQKLAPYMAGAMAKGSLGLAAGLAPAIAIAAGMKKDEKPSKSIARAALVGGVASGLRGAGERALFLKGMGAKLGAKELKLIAASGGGKVLSGAVGAAILDRLVRVAAGSLGKKDEKKVVSRFQRSGALEGK